LSRNKIKILVLGSTGMLGHMVLRILSADNHFCVFGTELKKNGPQFYFDVLKGIEGLKKICRKHKFDYFINCIGITRNKIDETVPSSIANAITINSLFPQELAVLAGHCGSRVIQISTDGVFSNDAKICYENSPCDSSDVYGRTKRLGEVFCDNFLNIRCSIIGPSPYEKGGIIEWFLSCPENSTITGYTNHLWNGVTTLQYADLCRKIILKGTFDSIVQESGTHHFCPNRPVSKYRLLMLLKAALAKKIKIISAKSKSGNMKRILNSRYKSLKQICNYNMPMQKAITELTGLITNIKYSKKIRGRKCQRKNLL